MRSFGMMRRSRAVKASRRLMFFHLLFALFLASAGARAADTEEKAPPAEKEAEEALSLATVNESFTRIETLRAELDSIARLAELQTRLEQLETETASAIEERLLGDPIANMGRRPLKELLLAISRKTEETGRLRKDLSGAIAKGDAIRESLRGLSKQWVGALEAPDIRELPEELTSRVKQLARGAETAYLTAQKRLGELVELEARALSLSNRFEALVAQAAERERVLRGRTFAISAPPVWTAVSRLTVDNARSDVSLALGTIGQALADLAAAYSDRLALHAFAGVLILVFVLVIRRSPLLTSQPDRESARQTLAHPLAVTVILTLTLTQPLYPTAQPAALILNSMLFLAAELVVLCAVLPWMTARRSWLLGTLLTAALCLQLLPPDTPLSRLTSFVVTLGGIGALTAIWRISTRDPSIRFWRARRLAGALVLLFSLLLAAALVANSLGAVGFATYAAEAVRRSSLAAVGLATLSLVLDILAGLVLASAPADRLRSICDNRRAIDAKRHTIVTSLAFLLWFWESLNAFRLRDMVVVAGKRALGATFEVGELTISPGAIVVFLLSLWLAVYVSRLTRFFLDQDVLPRLSLPRGVPGAISTGTHYLILAMALVFGTAAIGLDLSKLAFVAGALGVGIGFGLQNIVNNFMSGLILLFERPIQTGDTVQVGQLMGVVKRIGVRASIVRAYDGSEVIVPNGDLISQQVTNYTLSDRSRRIELYVGVAYNTDLEHAKATMEEAVKSVEDVAEDPAPFVLFQSFGDSALVFRVLFWVSDFDNSLTAASAVGISIRRALTREGIEIPFPQRDVHLRGSPDGDESQATGSDTPVAGRDPETENPELNG